MGFLSKLNAGSTLHGGIYESGDITIDAVEGVRGITDISPFEHCMDGTMYLNLIQLFLHNLEKQEILL
jgi:hypothetical protein